MISFVNVVIVGIRIVKAVGIFINVSNNAFKFSFLPERRESDRIIKEVDITQYQFVSVSDPVRHSLRLLRAGEQTPVSTDGNRLSPL